MRPARQVPLLIDRNRQVQQRLGSIRGEKRLNAIGALSGITEEHLMDIHKITLPVKRGVPSRAVMDLG